MAKMRHWKEHWSPTADLIFLKRLRMGDDPDKPYVFPGDPVTPEWREKLGIHRLRRWWEAQVVGLAPEPEVKPKTKKKVKKSVAKKSKKKSKPKPYKKS